MSHSQRRRIKRFQEKAKRENKIMPKFGMSRRTFKLKVRADLLTIPDVRYTVVNLRRIDEFNRKEIE